MNNKKKLITFMKKFFEVVLVALFFWVTFCVSCDIISFYCEKKYYQAEFSSQTNEKFYQKMVKMDIGSKKSFNGFPTCLTGIFNSSPGETILTTETDTLYFVYRNLNDEDLNKYPFYIVMDNHDNAWSIFRHNEEFHLFREDGIKLKKLLQNDTKEPN